VHSRASIKDDAWRFSLIATSLVATLLLTLYRSPRVLALGLLPVASGALAGVAAVSIVFGSVHGITLGFGATLIGEGVDYAIYLFTQIAPNVTPRNTLARIWPTLRLGVLTSICGFSAMLLASFPGLAQLGLFSIVGLIVAVAVTRYVLPALLPIDFTVRAANTLAPAVNAAAQRAAVLRYPLIGLVVLAAAFIVMRESALQNDSLASLSPVSMRDQALDADLRRAIGAPDVRHLVVVTAKDEQAALEASEKNWRAFAAVVRAKVACRI
jgi:predicted exporter